MLKSRDIALLEGILKSVVAPLSLALAAFWTFFSCSAKDGRQSEFDEFAYEFREDGRPIPQKIVFGETDVSELPSVVIETEGGEGEIADEYAPCSIAVFAERRAEWNLGAAEAKIKVRGHHSAAREKKPFAVKFSQPQNLLGMGAGKKWVLLADYQDNTHLRNDLAFFLSRRLGAKFTPKGRHCYVFLNGGFLGLYYLCEKIDAAKNRVDIDEKKDFLLEIDKYYDEKIQFRSKKMNMPYMIKSDGADEMRLEKFKAFVAKMEAEIEKNPASCKKYLDYESWAKWFLVKALLSHDVYDEENSRWRSVWAFWRGGKIFAAAPWDFDSGFLTRFPLQDFPVFYCDTMLKDKNFEKTVFKAWKDAGISADEIEKFLDEKKKRLSRPYALDCAVWGEHPDGFVLRNTNLAFFPNYSQQVDFVKEFCKSQIALLDAQCEKGVLDVSAW